MTVFEALSLMIAFASLIVFIISLFIIVYKTLK